MCASASNRRPVARRKYLSRDEENALFDDLTDENRRRILMNNYRLIYKIARKFMANATPGVEIGDLVSEGCIGCYKAMEKFDPARGNRFFALAVFYVEREMIDLVYRRNQTIKMPLARHRRYPIQVSSFDDELTDLEQVMFAPPGSRFQDARRRKLVDQALARLTSRQERVLRSYSAGTTLKQIGKGMGLSRERVRQIREEALERLRRYSSELRDL